MALKKVGTDFSSYQTFARYHLLSNLKNYLKTLMHNIKFHLYRQGLLGYNALSVEP